MLNLNFYGLIFFFLFSAIVFSVIFIRDWKFFEIADGEIFLFNILGLIYSFYYAGSFLQFLHSLIAPVVLAAYVLIFYGISLLRKKDFIGSGDIALAFGTGLWVGTSGLVYFLLLLLGFCIFIAFVRIPIVMKNIALESSGSLPDDNVFRPTQFNIIPLACPILLSIVCLLVLRFLNIL